MSDFRRFTVRSLLALVAWTAVGFALLRLLPTIGILWWIGVAAAIVHRRPTASVDRRPAVWRGLTALFATSIAWISVFGGSPAPFLVPVCWYVAAARRTAWTMAIFLLAGPPTLLSAHAAVDYFRGSAALRKRSEYLPPYANIDPTYRTRYDNRRTDVYYGEWARTTYNEMLVCLIRVVGPMKGSYDGPYPTESEATPAARRGAVVPTAAIATGVIFVDGVTTRLAASTAADVRRAYETYVANAQTSPCRHPQVTIRPMRAALRESRCLMLWIPVEFCPRGNEEYGVTVLIDRDVGRAFAVYYDRGGWWAMWADWRP
jgi:hypothetical protein